MANDSPEDLVGRRTSEVATWHRHVHTRPVLREVQIDGHVAWAAVDDLGICAIAPDPDTLSELVGRPVVPAQRRPAPYPHVTRS